MKYELPPEQIDKIEKHVYRDVCFNRVTIYYPHTSRIVVIYDREIIKTKSGMLLTFLN